MAHSALNQCACVPQGCSPYCLTMNLTLRSSRNTPSAHHWCVFNLPTTVRQVVGYDRVVGEHAYRQLTELYRALRLYVNCFQPSMKLQLKQREGEETALRLRPSQNSSPTLASGGSAEGP